MQKVDWVGKFTSPTPPPPPPKPNGVQASLIINQSVIVAVG